MFLQWRLKFLIKLSYLIFVSYVHSRFKTKALITKKHKAINYESIKSIKKEEKLDKYSIITVPNQNIYLGEKNTVRSLYVFAWCVCQNHLSFYIWTPTELLYKQQSMFWIYGSFGIVTIVFCSSFCMLYNLLFYSCRPCDPTLFFSSF